MNGLNWYDYGARHYDPAIARWMAQDPFAEKYYGWNPYNYCGANPVIRVDSEGKIWETVWDVISIAAGVKNLTDNISQGNYEAALADGAGILVDVVAAVIPFVTTSAAYTSIAPVIVPVVLTVTVGAA